MTIGGEFGLPFGGTDEQLAPASPGDATLIASRRFDAAIRSAWTSRARRSMTSASASSRARDRSFYLTFTP